MATETVAEAYRPLRKHPKLFDDVEGWDPEWFDLDFIIALKENTDDAWSKVLREDLPGAVFSVKMFTDEFCDLLIEEVENFAATGLPARRPNSMNNYGVILNDIGWKPMVDMLQRDVLAKVAAKHWPKIGPFDGHHTFIVRYAEGEDLGLDMHTDDSDVTFNICLGKEFTGAGLSFCGVLGHKDHRRHHLTYMHEKGRCCFHLGNQRHGADDIASGERLNLIIWNHSSAYRKTVAYKWPSYSREAGPPDAVCLSFTHDRDYGVFKEYTKKNLKFLGKGWCPPARHEYSGFLAEKGAEANKRTLESCDIL